MNRSDVLNATGLALSVLGLVVALAQTLRYREAQKSLSEIKRRNNADIWQGMSLILQAYESLDDARSIRLLGFPRSDLAAKISSARRAVIALYIHQLRQATLDEPVFTEETIRHWIKTGRLENEWRVQQARKFIRGVAESKDSRPPAFRLLPRSRRPASLDRAQVAVEHGRPLQRLKQEDHVPTEFPRAAA
jgi:hypothetical protein